MIINSLIKIYGENVFSVLICLIKANDNQILMQNVVT